MKKIKEFIKKIGNKKYCLLSLLLASLLLFAIISQLNNNKNRKANAQVTTNNEYVVNGYKFKYDTSMNNLKQNGIFTNSYLDTKLIISEGTEGLASIITIGNQITNLQNFTDIIYFYRTNEDNEQEKLNYTLIGDGTIINSEATENLGYVYSINEVNENNDYYNFINSTNTQKITINLLDYFNDIGDNNLEDGVLVQMAFINRDFNQNNATDEQKFNNTIYYNYYLSKPLNYTFNFPVDIRSKNYQCNTITISSASAEINNNYYIKEKTSIKNFEVVSDGDAYDNIVNTRLSTYNELKIIQNNQDGVIVACEPKYIFDLKSSSNVLDGNILTGDYLLNYESYPYTTSRAYESISNFLTFGNQTPIRGTGNLFQIRINNINSSNFYLDGQFDIDTYYPSQEIDFVWDKGDLYKVKRINGDRTILNVLGVRTLSNAKEEKPITGEVELDYSIINTLISDKLTGLQFVEKVQPEKPQDSFDRFKADFFYFLNSSLIGAGIGFAIGLLVGHPLAGAGIGFAIGAGIGAVPLVGDFLEAIGIPNNIGGFIRDNIMSKLPQIIPNPGNPGNGNMPNNGVAGVPWWTVLLIVVVLSALIYVFNKYLKEN